MHTKLTLEISARAEDDFTAIWEKQAEQSIEVASELVQKVAHKIFSLEYLAHNYPLVPETECFGVPYRELQCHPYKVLFQVDKQHVQVLRVL